MLARIAQELFWLGRDLTRAEHTARMLDGAFHADVVGVGAGSQPRGIALSWNGVLAVIGAKPPAPGEEVDEVPEEQVEDAAEEAASSSSRGSASSSGRVPGSASRVAGATRRVPGSASRVSGSASGAKRPPGWAPPGPLGRGEIAPLLTLDTDNPASVVSCVYRARERARTLRDVISTEMWEALNSFYLSLGRYDLEAALATGPYSVYQEVKERCSLFWGLLGKTMLRDEARSFLDAGGRIEEADMVLRMLRVSVPVAELPTPAGEPPRRHEGEALALLQAVGGFQAFRRHLRQSPTLVTVGSFLLYESAYPGSVLASLEQLREALATADPTPRSSPPVLRLGRLIADLELHQRTTGRSESLIEMLARVQNELTRIDRDIDDRYFAVAALGMVHV